jgi:hypothetical protein
METYADVLIIQVRADVYVIKFKKYPAIQSIYALISDIYQ